MSADRIEVGPANGDPHWYRKTIQGEITGDATEVLDFCDSARRSIDDLYESALSGDEEASQRAFAEAVIAIRQIERTVLSWTREEPAESQKRVSA